MAEAADPIACVDREIPKVEIHIENASEMHIWLIGRITISTYFYYGCLEYLATMVRGKACFIQSIRLSFSRRQTLAAQSISPWKPGCDQQWP